MEYTLQGEDLINIYDCLSGTDRNSLLLENHSKAVTKLQHYLHFFCSKLMEGERKGDKPHQVQLTDNQMMLIDSILHTHVRELQQEYKDFNGLKSQRNELADDIISYMQTSKRLRRVIVATA